MILEEDKNYSLSQNRALHLISSYRASFLLYRAVHFLSPLGQAGGCPTSMDKWLGNNLRLLKKTGVLIKSQAFDRCSTNALFTDRVMVKACEASRERRHHPSIWSQCCLGDRHDNNKYYNANYYDSTELF